MTALPIHQPISDVQLALQAAHRELSLRDYDRASAYAHYDKDHAIRCAAWYVKEAEPAADLEPTQEAIETYRALAEAMDEQFYYLTVYTGIAITFTVDDPYESSADMFDQVYATGALRVFKTQESLHPIWTDKQNDTFRAVHDLLGHCTWANSFGPMGEDAAYLSHIATLPRLVWPALCSETRGQNATFNYGHLIDRREPFQYARQSWLLSPRWVCM